MKAFAAYLVVGLVVVVIALILLNHFDPGQTELRDEKTQIALQEARELAPFWLAAKQVGITALAVILLAVAAIALSFGLAALGNVPNIVRWGWVRSWTLKPTKVGGLYGTLVAPDGEGHIRVLDPVNEPRAAIVAAATNGVVDRFGGAAMRQLMRTDDPQYQLPAQATTPMVDLSEALTFDPVQSPHALFVGDTGSGKSTAIYTWLDAIRRRLPADFLILEREAANWNDQAAAVSVAGYLAALEQVEAERLVRAAQLRKEDVDHISKLHEQPKYLVVVIEEAESVYTAMKLLGQKQAQRYTAIVRDLAAMGRKQGIVLVVATQTGTSDVFDVPTRKNLGHKFFFRNEPAVADQWGIDRKTVNLSRLTPGEAWSLNHGALVQFPKAARPKLPASRLYRERRPEELLEADAEADGIGANDMPDTIDGTAVSVPNWPRGGEGETSEAVVPVVPVRVQAAVQEVSFDSVTGAEQLDAAQRQYIIDKWEELCRKKGHPPALAEAQRAALRYSGGAAYYIVEPVLREYLQSQGKPLPWRRG